MFSTPRRSKLEDDSKIYLKTKYFCKEQTVPHESAFHISGQTVGFYLGNLGFETFYRGQITFSTQLIKPNFHVTGFHPQFQTLKLSSILFLVVKGSTHATTTSNVAILLPHLGPECL